MSTPKFPGTISRSARNTVEVVRIVQSLLQSRGFYAGRRIDGKFGPATEEAVRYFQMCNRNAKGKPLDVDGVVGPETWAALHATTVQVPLPQVPFSVIPQGLNKQRQALLERAWKEFANGTKEVPRGANYGDGVTKFLEGIGPAPWCMLSASWLFKDVTGDWPMGVRYGLVLEFWRSAKRGGTAIPLGTERPLPGDFFVLLDKNSKGQLRGTGHTGFVVSVSPDGKKYNTLAGNEGDAYQFGSRSFSQDTLVGFVSLLPRDCTPERKWTAVADVASLTTR